MEFVNEREKLRVEKAEFQKGMEAAMQKQLAFERAKLKEDAANEKKAMEEYFSIRMACIAADAKAERLAEKQETQEFVKTQVAELNAKVSAEQKAREDKVRKKPKFADANVPDIVNDAASSNSQKAVGFHTFPKKARNVAKKAEPKLPPTESV